MNEGAFFLILFLIVAVLGLRGSIRLTRRYHDVRDQLLDREKLLLLAIVIVAWAITLTALYFGVLSVRRLLGFDPIPQLAPVSAAIAIAVFLIPAFLDAVVDRVARVPWDIKPAGALESSVQENIGLTRDAITKAGDAYTEANTVNEKIARLTELMGHKEDKVE